MAEKNHALHDKAQQQAVRRKGKGKKMKVKRKKDQTKRRWGTNERTSAGLSYGFIREGLLGQ